MTGYHHLESLLPVDSLRVQRTTTSIPFQTRHTYDISKAPILQSPYATIPNRRLTDNAHLKGVVNIASGVLEYFLTRAELCRYTASRFPIQKWVSCHVNPLGLRNESLDSFADSIDAHLDCGGCPAHSIDAATDSPTANASELRRPGHQAVSGKPHAPCLQI